MPTVVIDTIAIAYDDAIVIRPEWTETFTRSLEENILPDMIDIRRSDENQ